MGFKKKLKFKAFSLMELMIVLLILSIVLAALMPIMTKRPKAGAAGGSVPAGTIVTYAGASVPNGWLLCDGTCTYPKTGVYESLFNALGGAASPYGISGSNFCVPDLRGYFIRGLDTRTSSYNDPYYAENGNTARPIGTIQTDAMQKITGTFIGLSNSSATGAFTSGSTFPAIGTGGTITPISISFNSSTSSSPNTAKTSDYETRPKNIALNYIIKY